LSAPPSIGEYRSFINFHVIFTFFSHVFGQPAKKEHGIENVKVTGSAWDTNVVAASGVNITLQ
jgi:hypothetical protein